MFTVEKNGLNLNVIFFQLGWRQSAPVHKTMGSTISLPMKFGPFCCTSSASWWKNAYLKSTNKSSFKTTVGGTCSQSSIKITLSPSDSSLAFSRFILCVNEYSSLSAVKMSSMGSSSEFAFFTLLLNVSLFRKWIKLFFRITLKKVLFLMILDKTITESNYNKCYVQLVMWFSLRIQFCKTAQENKWNKYCPEHHDVIRHCNICFNRNKFLTKSV